MKLFNSPNLQAIKQESKKRKAGLPDKFMNKALFIDKDGTLLKDVSYNADPSLIQFNEGAVDALKALKKFGYKNIIITNQPGVALGYFTEDKIDTISSRIAALMHENELDFDGLYYCPHHPHGTVTGYSMECSCRKPSPGMIIKAAGEHNIDLSSSWIIGDILDDVEAGRSAGCRGVLLDNGNETEWILNDLRRPDAIVRNWLELVPIIKQFEDSDDERLGFMQESSLRKGG